MAGQRDPWVCRRLVGRALRDLRDQRHLTQAESARALGWSQSKVVRIEAGTHGVSAPDLRAILELYEVTAPAEVGAYLAMADEGNGTSWYEPYRDVLSGNAMRLFAYESICTGIRVLSPLHIPGQLQTPEYAREQLKPYYVGDQLERAVQARCERQQRNCGTSKPPAVMVIDESAIRRLVGGEDVMRGQLERLLAASEDPTKVIRVIPFASGWHAGLEGPFILLDIDNPLRGPETVLYREQSDTDFLTGDNSDLLRLYKYKWHEILSSALPEDGSRDLIAEQIRRLGW